jgi:hypothetical protein
LPRPARSVPGVSHPLDGFISLRPCGLAGSAAAPGISLAGLFRAGRPGCVAAPAAPCRRRCSTASNSEEYEVGSSADSKALEPVRPGSMAMVPEPPSPLRSTSLPDRRGCSRLRSFPLALRPEASGRTMTLSGRRPRAFDRPGNQRISRDPQLPWGSLLQSGRRSGAFRCSTPLDTGMSFGAGSSRRLSPPEGARRGFPPRTSLPCQRTIKDPSTKAAVF